MSLISSYLVIEEPPLSVVGEKDKVIELLVAETKVGLGGAAGTDAATISPMSDQSEGPTAFIALYLKVYVFPFTILLEIIA